MNRDSGCVAHVEEMPDAIAVAETRELPDFEIQDALIASILATIELGEPIPMPSGMQPVLNSE